MERLTLNEATKELEKLENDKKYWENRLEQIVSLTMPHSTDTQSERVDGGTKIDDKILTLNKWVEGELRRLDKYGETEKTIVYLRERKLVRDKYTNRMRKMTWQEIAKETHYSERSVRYFYNNWLKQGEKNGNKKKL